MLRVSRSMESDLYVVVFARLSSFGHCAAIIVFHLSFTFFLFLFLLFLLVISCFSWSLSCPYRGDRPSRDRSTLRSTKNVNQDTLEQTGKPNSRDNLFNVPVGVEHALFRASAPKVNARSAAPTVCLQNSICERLASGSADRRELIRSIIPCPRFFAARKNEQRDTAKFLINGRVFRAFYSWKQISDPL